MLRDCRPLGKRVLGEVVGSENLYTAPLVCTCGDESKAPINLKKKAFSFAQLVMSRGEVVEGTATQYSQ